MSSWTIFSNYGHVLVCLAREPDIRLRDVAEAVGITERAVQKIVRDLQAADYIKVTKQGRRNTYLINRRSRLRHNLEQSCRIGVLLDLVLGKEMDEHSRPARKAARANREPRKTDRVEKPVEKKTQSNAPLKPAKGESETKKMTKKKSSEAAKNDHQGSLF